MALSKEDIDLILTGIYKGVYTPAKLPKKLYEITVDALLNAVVEGYGAGGSDVVLKEIATNIYLFSGAKTFQQFSELSSEAKGLDFEEFKLKALPILEKYNKTWLNTEVVTATVQSQNARAWQDYKANAKQMPYLMYQTSDDDRVSDICAPLDNVVKRFDDPFWNTFSPANHYRCRCYLKQISDSIVTPDSLIKIKQRPSELFQNNVGKTGEIFNKSHPYFDVPKKYRGLAKKNFNLPTE